MKNFLKKLLALIPTRLPQGLSEFESWSNEIISLYGSPNNDSVKFSLAVMILHLDSTTSHKPKAYFGRALRKAASNQVVSQVINDLKDKQAKALEASKATEPVTNAT